MTIADNINQLIRPHTTTVQAPNMTRLPVPTTNPRALRPWIITHTAGTHPQRTEHPPLLDQLEDSTTLLAVNGDLYHGNPDSKPPARLDAVALVQRINHQTAAIEHDLGITRAGNLRTRLSRIAGETANLDTDGARHIDTTTRSWVIAARIITGHDAPPYQPDVPCPNTECERRSTLRIRLEDRIATCTECGSVWDEHTITQLGVYVRWAAEHLTGPRHWLTDPDGYPVECTECLETRQEMGERAAVRALMLRRDHARTA